MSSISSDLASGGDTPFRIGSALSRAFEIYRAGFDKFFVLTFIPTAPILIIGVIFPGATGVLGFLRVILPSLATATCLYGAYRIMRGQNFDVSDSLRAGLHRLGPVVGTALLGGLLAGLATLLLIIPGVIAFCAIYVAQPACVIERLGAKNSLRRSWELTRGHRWAIFGLLLLLSVAVGVMSIGAGAPAALTGNPAFIKISSFALETVTESFGAVLAAVVYHDLRVAKEGVDIDTIASVFD